MKKIKKEESKEEFNQATISFYTPPRPQQRVHSTLKDSASSPTPLSPKGWTNMA